MATVVKVQGSFASGGEAFGAQVERELKKAGVPVTAVHMGNKILVSSGHLAWMADGPEIVFTYTPAVAPVQNVTAKANENAAGWIKRPGGATLSKGTEPVPAAKASWIK